MTLGEAKRKIMIELDESGLFSLVKCANVSVPSSDTKYKPEFAVPNHFLLP